MHGVLTLVGVGFMVLGVGFAAKAFGSRFRLYSAATLRVRPARPPGDSA